MNLLLGFVVVIVIVMVIDWLLVRVWVCMILDGGMFVLIGGGGGWFFVVCVGFGVFFVGKIVEI